MKRGLSVGSGVGLMPGAAGSPGGEDASSSVRCRVHGGLGVGLRLVWCRVNGLGVGPMSGAAGWPPGGEDASSPLKCSVNDGLGVGLMVG